MPRIRNDDAAHTLTWRRRAKTFCGNADEIRGKRSRTRPNKRPAKLISFDLSQGRKRRKKERINGREKKALRKFALERRKVNRERETVTVHRRSVNIMRGEGRICGRCVINDLPSDIKGLTARGKEKGGSSSGRRRKASRTSVASFLRPFLLLTRAKEQSALILSAELEREHFVSKSNRTNI